MPAAATCKNMASPRRAKIIRDLWLYRGRTILVVVAVAVGLAAFGTMHAGRAILSHSLFEGYARTNPAHVILTITDFDDNLLAEVRQYEQVERAEARRQIYARIEKSPGQWITLELQAIADPDNWQIGQLYPEAGQAIPQAGSVLLERSSQSLLDQPTEIGRPLQFATLDGQRHSLTISGTANDLAPMPATITLIAGGYLAMETVPALGEPTDYNQLYLRLAGDPADRLAVEQLLDPVVAQIEAAGYSVSNAFVPEPGRPVLADNVQTVTALLGTLGRLTLFLSGFLVFNVLSAVIVQQIPQIGILKSLGGRTSQIIGLYVQMVLILGLLALLLAVPLGLLGAYLMATFMSAELDFDVLHFRLPPRTLLLQAIGALLVPLLAALGPILMGARLTIHQAIGHTGLPAAGSRFLSQAGNLPRPLLLSLRNVLRRKGRVGLTLAALTLAGSMFIAVIGLRRSLQITLTRLQAASNYDVEIDLAQPYPAADLEEIALAAPAVTEVESWGIAGGRYRFADGRLGSTITLIGLPAETNMALPAVRQGRWLPANQTQALFVNADTLDITPGLAVDSQATLLINGQETQWQVIGSSTRNFVPLAYVERADFEAATGLAGLANRLVVRTRQSDPVSQAAAEADLLQRLDEAGFQVTRSATTTESNETLVAQLDTLVILLLAMAILVTVVGGLGLATTMSLSVLERTREIGVLRSLGAQSGTLRQMVVMESLVIGLVSSLLAVALSVPLGILLGDNLGITLLLYPLDYVFSVGGMLIWFGLIITISILSSLVPARQAARLSIRDALAYDG
jgi:putative ABC transport system permease protein